MILKITYRINTIEKIALLIYFINLVKYSNIQTQTFFFINPMIFRGKKPQ
jgi:hypothetical protein